jgi:uncharacterized membrane-anchored protein
MSNGDAISFVFGFVAGVALLWWLVRIVLAEPRVALAVDRTRVRN